MHIFRSLDLERMLIRQFFFFYEKVLFIWLASWKKILKCYLMYSVFYFSLSFSTMQMRQFELCPYCLVTAQLKYILHTQAEPTWLVAFWNSRLAHQPDWIRLRLHSRVVLLLSLESPEQYMRDRELGCANSDAILIGMLWCVNKITSMLFDTS